MDNDLTTYIERLELMVFFAGYPFIYAIVAYFQNQQRNKPGTTAWDLKKILPVAYALTGTLYFALFVRNIYPDYSIKNIISQFQNPYLRAWGLLSIMFWFPVFRKKTYFSLLHSLVFFFMLFKDLLSEFNIPGAKDTTRNDMKLYTDSLLLNTATFIAAALVYFLLLKKINRKGPIL